MPRALSPKAKKLRWQITSWLSAKIKLGPNPTCYVEDLEAALGSLGNLLAPSTSGEARSESIRKLHICLATASHDRTMRHSPTTKNTASKTPL